MQNTGDYMGDKITVKNYVEYLQRYIRNRNESIWEAHRYKIHREVAREYGLTEEEILWLDENL